MTRGAPIDLIVVACLSLATLGATLVGLDVPVARAALAGPLVFVLPGYALCMALFPARPRGLAELLLLSLGLSLGVAVLGGLVLNLTPWGLRAETWALLLCSITLAACLVAGLRRRSVQPNPVAPSRLLISPLHTVMLAASVVLVGGALWIARTPAPQQSNQTYSVLWAVPAADSAPDTVRVGVNSGESDRTAYIVRIVAGRQQLQEFAFLLSPTEVWETELTLTGVTDGTLEVRLYKASAPDVVYRRVALPIRGRT